jgi:hypothetical protein
MEYEKGWRSSNSTPLNGAIYNLDDYLPSGYVGDFMKMGYSFEDAKVLTDLAENSAISYNGVVDVAEATDSLVSTMNNVDFEKLKDLK